MRRCSGRSCFPRGARDGLAIEGDLLDGMGSAVTQDRTSVAQWARDSWIILHSTEKPVLWARLPQRPLRRCVLRTMAATDVSIHRRRTA
ncbi:TPA: hypothetical protein EYM82_06970 [Candidatus Poribacteria bacterium]|nr:hypothetical protein [Candidatus Poribacteria bacterium]